MTNETCYIPTNFTDAGRVMGLFEIRSLIEAVLLTLPILYLCLVFVPLALTPKIIVTLTVLVPVGGFGLIGISDDSLQLEARTLPADTADYVERLEVLEPRWTDDFNLKLLYEIINKRASRRFELPEGVFDMTTAAHGIYGE